MEVPGCPERGNLALDMLQQDNGYLRPSLITEGSKSPTQAASIRTESVTPPRRLANTTEQSQGEISSPASIHAHQVGASDLEKNAGASLSH